MESTELMHYGVKGMKWGVRRKRPDSTTGGIAGEKQNRERAEKYPANKKKDSKNAGQKAKKTAIKAAEVTAKVLSKVGQAYITDQVFFGGAGTRAVKQTVQAVGIVTISAWKAAHGATDIHWYDKQGRKIV